MRLTERDRLSVLAVGRETLGDSRVWASAVLARLQHADADVLDAGLHVYNLESDLVAPLVKDRQPFTEAMTSFAAQLDAGSRRRLFLCGQPAVSTLSEAAPDEAWAWIASRLERSGLGDVVLVSVPMSSAGGFALALGVRRGEQGAHERHRASLIELVAQLAGQFAAQRVLDRGSILDVAPRPTLDAFDAVLSGSVERLSREPGSEGSDLVERMLDEGWSVLRVSDHGVVAVRVGDEQPAVTDDDRAAVLMAAWGHSNDEIAQALGTSASGTAKRLSTNLRRLGITDRHVLARLVSMASGPSARVKVILEDTAFLVVTVDVAQGRAHFDERLTDAEKAVTALAVVGMSNAEIAAARGVSERTIANQLAAIYRKLGVSSRFELAANVD